MIKRMAEKGFTLIELLVVIAIIGILAGVVLTSLGSARSSAADSKVKSQLASMRAEAEIHATNNSGSYADVCVNALGFHTTAASRTKLFAGTTGTANCQDNASGWAASVQLVSNTARYWCVDSRGSSYQTSANVSATICPAQVN